VYDSQLLWVAIVTPSWAMLGAVWAVQKAAS
jgi:hypothetical protein